MQAKLGRMYPLQLQATPHITTVLSSNTPKSDMPKNLTHGTQTPQSLSVDAPSNAQDDRTKLTGARKQEVYRIRPTGIRDLSRLESTTTDTTANLITEARTNPSTPKDAVTPTRSATILDPDPSRGSSQQNGDPHPTHTMSAKITDTGPPIPVLPIARKHATENALHTHTGAKVGLEQDVKSDPSPVVTAALGLNAIGPRTHRIPEDPPSNTAAIPTSRDNSAQWMYRSHAALTQPPKKVTSARMHTTRNTGAPFQPNKNTFS